LTIEILRIPQHRLSIKVEPLSMGDLLERVADARQVVPGLNHGATDYVTWLRGAADHERSSYSATYTLGWEPYIIMNKRLWTGMTKRGMFDRRFRKRGWDKASFVYEVAAMGYNFRVLRGVFVAHVSDESFVSCPPAFGSDFCAVAADSVMSNSMGWRETLSGIDSSFRLFASFIKSLSEYFAHNKSTRLTTDLDPPVCAREEQLCGNDGELGYLDRARARDMHSWCMIFPSHFLSNLSRALIHQSLLNAYNAHAHANAHMIAKFGEDWLQAGHWVEFSSLWCMSVPLMVGHLTQHRHRGRIVIHIDRRIFESYSGPLQFERFHYYHSMAECFNRPHCSLSSSKSAGRLFVELSAVNASSMISDSCTKANDTLSLSLWHCNIRTEVQDAAGNSVLQLTRHTMLTTDLMPPGNVKWTVVVSVSRGFIDMFENWHYWFQLLALNMHIVLIAEDEQTFKQYEGRNDMTTKAGTFRDRVDAFEYESREYKHLVSSRAKYLLSMLESYSYVIYTDVDTVWLEDPRPHFKGDFDVWMTLDEEIPTTFCTGFMALLPTSSTVDMLGTWDLELSKAPQLNQPIFNKLLHQKSLKVGKLDRQLFPSGDLYFGEEGVRSLEPQRDGKESGLFHRRGRVVLVHNNWIIGKEKKIQRFINVGLWKDNRQQHQEAREQEKTSRMRHPEDVPLSLMIRPPECSQRTVTDTDGATYEWLCGAFEARVHGLVAGADYIVGMNLNDGSRDIFQDEWVLEDAHFLCTIPPLPRAVRSVRVSIFDGFKGLSRDESMLAATVQDVKMSRAPEGDPNSLSVCLSVSFCLSLSLSFCLSFSLARALSLSLSRSHTHKHTHTRAHTHGHTHTRGTRTQETKTQNEYFRTVPRH